MKSSHALNNIIYYLLEQTQNCKYLQTLCLFVSFGLVLCQNAQLISLPLVQTALCHSIVITSSMSGLILPQSWIAIVFLVATSCILSHINITLWQRSRRTSEENGHHVNMI